MKRGLSAAGAAILLTLLLTPVFGTEWVNAGGDLNPTVNPQRVSPPASVVNGNIEMAGRVLNNGGSPELGMPMMLEYVYIDPSLYSIFSYPWYGYASGMRWQSLYPKDLIGRPGTIHEMALFKSYYPTYYNGTFPNVTVKLVNTTVTSLSSNLNSNYGGATPVKVFHASSLTRGYQHGSDDWGWDTVDFDTDFDYDSSKSLLVEVTWQGSASGYSYTWGTYNSGGALGAYYYGDSLGNSGSTYNYLFNTRIGFVPPANNVGVSKILSPADRYSAYGDTVYPICVVNNRGSAEQDNVPVRCKINEHRSGTVVYNQVQHVNLPAGAADTVYFPGYLPPVQDALYDDTMRTENPGDARPGDDMQATWFKVALYGSFCLGYNNGTFDNAISWANWGWWATKFPQPPGGACSGANFWITTFNGADVPEHVQLFGNDGPGNCPGTMFYDTAVVMHTGIWTSLYKNHYDFATPITVDYDSFFVAEYEQTWQSGSGYVYLGLCYGGYRDDIDWGKYQDGSWGAVVFSGGQACFGIDYCYAAPLIDASCVGITMPPATIDSNTTFTPVIQIKNTGLHDRKHVPYTFHIVRDVAPFDTVYTGSGDAGAIETGKTVDVTLSNPSTPLPGHYTMTGITNVLYDNQNQNDAFAAPLFVRYYNVQTQIVSPRQQEVPGLVPVAVRLTNRGNVPALVPRLDVRITGTIPYSVNRLNLPAIAVGESEVITLNSWVCPASVRETCTAWITDPEDMDRSNPGSEDTAMQAVTAGIPGWTEMNPLPAPPSGKPIKDGACMAYDSLTGLIYASKGNKTGDFYAYDVTAGTWANKKGIPLGAEGKTVGRGSVICSDRNGDLYLTKGNNTVGFWEYSADGNAWEQKTNVPLGSSNKTPVVFDLACNCGNPASGTCLSQQWMWDSGGKGAVASFASSSLIDTGPAQSQCSLAVGATGDYHTLQYGSTEYLAPVFDLGGIQMLMDAYIATNFPTVTSNIYSFMWLGDPAMPVWSGGIPTAVSVSHPAQIQMGAQCFPVSVRTKSDNQPVENARVCVYKPNDFYAVGLTNASGEVTLSLTALSEGSLYVSASEGHELLSSQGSPHTPMLPYFGASCVGVSSPYPNSDRVPLHWSLSVSLNPARGAFSVRYDVPHQTRVSVGVYDADGRLVRSLREGETSPGRYEARLPSGVLPAGIYFLRLDTTGFRSVKKAVVAR